MLCGLTGLLIAFDAACRWTAATETLVPDRVFITLPVECGGVMHSKEELEKICHRYFCWVILDLYSMRDAP